MAIRLPLTVVGQFDDDNDTGTGSVAGGIPHTFLLPQDCDNVVVKMTASVAGTGVSTFLQTSDDGGTTWYDVARTSIVSNANSTTAQWLSVPVIGGGVATGKTFATGSIVSMGIGNAAASSLGQQQVSGLPILNREARVFNVIAGDVTGAASNSWDVTVYTNSQSGDQ